MGNCPEPTMIIRPFCNIRTKSTLTKGDCWPGLVESSPKKFPGIKSRSVRRPYSSCKKIYFQSSFCSSLIATSVFVGPFFAALRFKATIFPMPHGTASKQPSLGAWVLSWSLAFFRISMILVDFTPPYPLPVSSSTMMPLLELSNLYLA